MTPDDSISNAELPALRPGRYVVSCRTCDFKPLEAKKRPRSNALEPLENKHSCVLLKKR
jgi:hypothetical protein